jgi:microcystin-dependent protein
MPAVKISDLPEAGPLAAADQMPVVQGGATVRASVTQLRTAAGVGLLQAANNLSDLTDAAAARGNLGLGSAAVMDGGQFAMTGEVRLWLGAAAPAGWRLLNGDTIGAAGSGAVWAAAEAEPLYAFLWDNLADGEAPVSGGRGAAAADDFAAGKALTLPDARGRVPLGAGAGPGLTARVLGTTGGEEAHQLTIAEMPSHSHGISSGNDECAHGSSRLQTVRHEGYQSGSTGGDQPHNTMPPWLSLSLIVKT